HRREGEEEQDDRALRGERGQAARGRAAERAAAVGDARDDDEEHAREAQEVGDPRPAAGTGQLGPSLDAREVHANASPADLRVRQPSTIGRTMKTIAAPTMVRYMPIRTTGIPGSYTTPIPEYVGSSGIAFVWKNR